MSFDVFVQCHENGGFGSFPRHWLRDAFGPHLVETEQTFWQVHYAETDYCYVYLTALSADADMIRSFTINRPCADVRFWDALASILAAGHLVLYFPGCRAPLVARPSARAHLPPSMIETLGQPICVSSGREILDEIHAA
jgi:hypothetical protein